MKITDDDGTLVLNSTSIIGIKLADCPTPHVGVPEVLDIAWLMNGISNGKTQIKRAIMANENCLKAGTSHKEINFFLYRGTATWNNK